MTVAELESTKKKIEELQKEVSMNEGRLSSVMETLKKDFNIESIEEIDDLLENLQDEIDNFEKDKEKAEKEINAIFEKHGIKL